MKCTKIQRAHELAAAYFNTRLLRSRQRLCKYLPYAINFIFFTDEKGFTVAPPANLQNGRVCAPVGTKKRDYWISALLLLYIFIIINLIYIAPKNMFTPLGSLQ